MQTQKLFRLRFLQSATAIERSHRSLFIRYREVGREIDHDRWGLDGKMVRCVDFQIWYAVSVR